MLLIIFIFIVEPIRETGDCFADGFFVNERLNMSKKESQNKLFQHSEIKVRVLRLYLERYLNVLTLSKYVGDIYIHDLFCGEGIYEEGGKGSPITILETINSIHLNSRLSNHRTGHFICHFNDFDSQKVDKLKEEIRKANLFRSEMGKLHFTKEDYQTLLPKIIRKVNSLTKEKAFIFIDPYGYKDISIKDIEALLKCRKTEVLLFLPTQFMFRFEKKGTPESLKEFINELVPEEKWPNSHTGIAFIENLRDAFRKAIGGNFFVDSFIITRDKNQFFCLFFFTSHIYGFDRMLDAKWEIDEEEGRGWHYEQELSLFKSASARPNTDKFEKALFKFLTQYRSNGELYKFTLHNGHLPSHTNEILSKIQNDGRLLIKCADGKPLKKSTFYVRYTEFRDAPERVRMKIV